MKTTEKEKVLKSVRVGTMQLVDNYTGKMICSICGSVHHANIKPMSNGQYYKSAWKCVYGCKKEN